jgi:N-acetylmuramoyl-L-alanine amidase CwlA
MAVWQDKFINVNQYARSGKKIKSVRKIVMHWTANPGATAENHYRYFGNLKGTYASAHFFVDKDEAICIIPLNEMAYHANDVQQRDAKGNAWRGVKELLPNANQYSIGVEMCVEKDGTLHRNMLDKAKLVVAELCKRYDLNPLEDIVRHYDVTHKNCPAHWVKDPLQFEAFKKEVNSILHPVVDKPVAEQVYRVRKEWKDVASQIGAFKDLASAKDMADKNKGFEVYDKDGKVAYTPKVEASKTPVKEPVKPVTPKPTPKPPVKPKAVLPKGVFKQGDKGNDVKKIQDALNELNFKCGTADGVWGSKTTDALKRFQSMYCSPADGVYGAKTKAKMEELLNK